MLKGLPKYFLTNYTQVDLWHHFKVLERYWHWFGSVLCFMKVSILSGPKVIACRVLTRRQGTRSEIYSAFNNSVNLLSLKYLITLTSNQYRVFSSSFRMEKLRTFINIKPYAEDPISIWPMVAEIFERKWVHRISKYSVIQGHHIRLFKTRRQI